MMIRITLWPKLSIQNLDTPKKKSVISLSQCLRCNLIQQPLPSLLQLFQACNQCAAGGHPPDVSNTPHHPRSSPADHNPLSCHQVQQTQYKL